MLESKLKSLRIAPTIVLALLVVAMTGGTAVAAGAPFIQKASGHSFGQTVSNLKHAVSGNGMMVLGRVNQGKVMSMTGLQMKGESFFVGNPTMGKKIFKMSPAAGAVVPLRIYVWEAGGKSHVGYFEPSSLLSGISPKLGMPGKMLDKKFAHILKETVR